MYAPETSTLLKVVTPEMVLFVPFKTTVLVAAANVPLLSQWPFSAITLLPPFYVVPLSIVKSPLTVIEV